MIKKIFCNLQIQNIYMIVKFEMIIYLRDNAISILSGVMGKSLIRTPIAL